MRIAVNTRMLLKDRLEGIGRFTYETVKRLVLDHPNDDFFFFFDRAYDDSFIFADNVTPIVISPPARHPLLHYLWFEVRLPKILKEYRIDVFYSPDGYLSMRTEVPTLMVSHDIAYAHFPTHIPKSSLWYYRYFVPKFHKRADHLIAVSTATKQDLVETLDVNPNKVTIGYNSCTPIFHPISTEEKNSIREKYTGGDPFFIYVGSIHPRKNIANLLRAFAQFCKQSNTTTKLVLAGRWAWKTDEISDVYNLSEVKNRIVRLEHLTDELPQVMAAAEAMVYVSTFEGFGIPILEAMYCEIPVICSNISSMPEVAGDAAILVNPKNIQEIADAMLTVSENKELANELIAKGIQQREKFSWQRTADLIYAKLAEIANN